MRIAIVGATGTAGSATTLAARSAGHEVITLSRATGIDLHTGAGLIQGIRGADVVIDTSNAYPTTAGADLVTTFAEATTRLAEACRRTGVARLVHLSICNIDDPALDRFAYYLAKRSQEEALGETDLPHTNVRTAQWMEFALNPSAVTQTENGVRVEDWLIQPVAVAAVADVLVEAATRDPRDRQVAGPQRVRLPDLTRAVLESTGDTRPVLSTPPRLPALAEGVLLAPDGAELLGPDVAGWLTGRRPQD